MAYILNETAPRMPGGLLRMPGAAGMPRMREWAERPAAPAVAAGLAAAASEARVTVRLYVQGDSHVRFRITM